MFFTKNKMLDISILALGKMTDSFLKEGIEAYLKRLKPYVKIEIIELKSESFQKHSQRQAKQKEAQRIEKYLDKKLAQVFLLEEKGELLDSLSFSKKLHKLDSGKIILVLGGSLGFSEELSKKYKSLSLSPLTFTHEIARLIIVEQIYRAISIEKGKDYHY